MDFKKINDEVYYTSSPICKLTARDIAFLKNSASGNERLRARVCTHPSVEDFLHEMVIVHGKNNYVPPHKHLHHSESFHLIEGMITVVVFENTGEIAEVINMGHIGDGECFYCRLPDTYFHTAIIRSEFAVFHETTNGPFKRGNTVFAPWAPEEQAHGAIEKYQKELLLKIQEQEMKVGAV